MIKHKIIIRKKTNRESTTTQTTTVSKEYEIEEIMAETLNLLFEGMTRGNQIDKKSSEQLIQSIKYKTSKEFYNNCLDAYTEALKIHEEVFRNVMMKKITQNIAEMIDKGRDALNKITQHIVIRSNENNPIRE